MANQRLRRAVRRVLATSAAATTVVAGSVMAQDQEAGVTETVVVTGTRLSRPDLESNSPLSTVSADEIRLQGSVNVEEVLLDLPQTVPGVSSTTNNGGDGTTTVNLRGLGSQRTLVLVDGKRFIPSDQGGAADLNAVPVSLLERIDVVTGGASAVYGSDAMAGVVNLILKKNFQGIQFDTQYGQTGESDGDQIDVNILVGNNFADGAGNVTAYAGYTQRDEIFQGDREFSSFALTEDGANPGTLIQQGSPTTDVGGFGIGNPALDTDGDGVVGVDANGNLTDPLQYYNFAPVNYLQIPQERYIIGAMGNYEVNQYAEAFARVAYANNTSKTQIAASGTFYDSFDVNPDNPFVPAATLDAFRDRGRRRRIRATSSFRSRSASASWSWADGGRTSNARRSRRWPDCAAISATPGATRPSSSTARRISARSWQATSPRPAFSSRCWWSKAPMVRSAWTRAVAAFRRTSSPPTRWMRWRRSSSR